MDYNNNNIGAYVACDIIYNLTLNKILAIWVLSTGVWGGAFPQITELTPPPPPPKDFEGFIVLIKIASPKNEFTLPISQNEFSR